MAFAIGLLHGSKMKPSSFDRGQYDDRMDSSQRQADEAAASRPTQTHAQG